MTLEDGLKRARELARRWHQTGGGVLEELIAAEFVAVAKEERERAAELVARDGDDGWSFPPSEIARQIRGSE